MTHPTRKDTRPPPTKVAASTPICLHLIVGVAPWFVVRYLGSGKVKAGVERIPTHRFALRNPTGLWARPVSGRPSGRTGEPLHRLEPVPVGRFSK